jgi:FeS assembly protein IscX
MSDNPLQDTPEEMNRADGKQDCSECFTWDDSYAIAKALLRLYPETNLESVSLGMIYAWTVALPGFDDDPSLANDQILSAIYQEWFEEANPL